MTDNLERKDSSAQRAFMTPCASCGSTIVLGGKVVDGLRYCNARCAGHGWAVREAQRVPIDEARQLAEQIHHGRCPRCNAASPVDVHTSYRVWSALVLTRWRSLSHVSCRKCGYKDVGKSMLSSLLLGWWALPGILVTPLQLVRNLGALLQPGNAREPSARLVQHARMILAAQRLGRTT